VVIAVSSDAETADFRIKNRADPLPATSHFVREELGYFSPATFFARWPPEELETFPALGWVR